MRAAAALALLLLASGCDRPAFTDPDRPHVLMLVLDACRADRLKAYGYEKDTAPAIDRLAADPDSVTFPQHYVQASWTKPSTASLFTGLFVHQHGVTMSHEATPEQGERSFVTQHLADDHETLAERFRAAGYFTFGVVKSYHLVPEYGFAQGFDAYHPPQEGLDDDRARVDLALEIMREAARPFFGYLHLASCHHPYYGGGRDEEFMDRHGFEYDEEARQEQGVDFTTHEIQRRINEEGLELGPRDVEFLSLIYDARLRNVDRYSVEPLLAGLRRHGLYDRTLLLLTADHGEELYDHRGYAHGHALWNEVVRVPLIVKFPRDERPAALAANLTALTQSIDLYPSLLGLLGMEVPEGLPGRSILAGEFGDLAVAEFEGEWTLVRDGWKLVETHAGPVLFDLETDAAETGDRAPLEPEIVEGMREVYRSIERSTPRSSAAPERETELSPEALEGLRSLGYIE